MTATPAPATTSAATATTAIAGRTRPPGPTRSLVLYGTMVVGPVLLALLLLRLGFLRERTQAVGSVTDAPAGVENTLAQLLLAVVVVILAARAMGLLSARLGQPPVIGEIAAGIILGPTVLGLLAPALSAGVFTPAVLPSIATLGEIGLLFFMFSVGLELDLKELRAQTHSAVFISHVSITLPFLLGVGLALAIHGPLAPEGVGFVEFALFLGAALSVTAFPVLARILSDRGLASSPVGLLVLTCAAVDDITAWCVLALVVALISSSSVTGAALTLALTLVFVAAMVAVVRPLLARLPRGRHVGTAAALPLVLAGIFLSATATQRIGIHAIFGAFLFGAICPRDLPVLSDVRARVGDFNGAFLLPLFFAYTGLRTQIGLLGTRTDLWLWCLLILVVATAGKWLGSTTAARFMGVPWRESAQVGVLMNCRGMTELVILNVGLDLGVLSPTLFAMLVIMALVSTALTAPVLDRLSGAPARQVRR